MVVWIIGLSGAGKTTLANEVVAQLRQQRSNVVLLDGDIVREVFGHDLGYSIEDRRKNASRICQLGKLLDDQGINVVCAILSLFEESRSWNRANLKNYYEVFIDAPLKNLKERDYKSIYQKFEDGEISQVAGMDLEFQRPEKSDLFIINNSSREQLLSHAKFITEKFVEKIK